MPDFKSGSTDPRQLNEGGDINLNPRNFFWDAVILYLGSSILALTAFDALSEYIRGSSVSCIDADKEYTTAYIAHYCGGSLPRAQYFPAFLYLHALAIVIPHFVFNASFGDQFDYFFSVARNLNTDEGKLSKNNVAIVRRLTASFTTYKQKSIYLCYVGKLVIQLLFACVTLYISIHYFTDFKVDFQCPRDKKQLNTTSYPFPTQATCVYNSLRLLYYLRIVDISLVAIICCAVLGGLWFCASSHPFYLQPKKVAMFSYQSGINPNMYSIDCGKCCPMKCCCGVISPRYLPRLFFPPMISTNFDFLLLKLARTNAGLGKLFRDILIELEIRDVIDQEKMTLTLHNYKYNSRLDALSKQAIGQHIETVSIPNSDIGWKYDTSPSETFGPVDDASLSCVSVRVPNTIRGTVFGLSGYAPTVHAALVIEFNKSGLALSLKRRFKKVSSILFCNAREMEADTAAVPSKPTDSSKDSDKKLNDLVKFVQNTEFFAEAIVSENAMIANGISSIDVLQLLTPLWKGKACFLVIGPMNERQAHLMNYFLTRITTSPFYLEENCLIVTLVPKRIGCQVTTDEDFQGFEGEPHNCTALDVNLDVATNMSEPLKWPPDSEYTAAIRKTTQSQSASNTSSGSNINALEEVPSDSESQIFINKTSNDSRNQRSHYRRRGINRNPCFKIVSDTFDLLCGETSVGFKIQAYQFNYEDIIDHSQAPEK